MKRHVALIITLFQLSGTVGVPVAAYTCVESGEVGVVSYFSGSARSCYSDSCCDSDEASTTGLMQNGIPCCDVDIHITPENNFTLLPGQKHEQVGPLADTPARFDASLPGVCTASTLPSVSAFHASINLPLLN
jgi:hypothetical protein